MTTKYNSQRQIIDGIKFDSKLESETYIQIKNAIKTLQDIQDNYLYIVYPQAKLTLSNGWTSSNTYNIPCITYRIDFLILKIDKTVPTIADFIFIESKGFCTKDFKLKVNLFLRSISIMDSTDFFYVVIAGSHSSHYQALINQGIEIVNCSTLYIRLIDRFFDLNQSSHLKNMKQSLVIQNRFWVRVDKESHYYDKEVMHLSHNFLSLIGM